MDAMNDGLPDELARAMAALRADGERRAAAVDPARVSRAVLERLKEPAPAARPAWQLASVRVAAAVVLIAAVGAAVEFGVPGAGRRAAVLPLESVAESFDAGQVDAMLQAVDSARQSDARGSTVAGSVTVEDLNEQELQTLLSQMDSEVDS
jgi:hypothetical protein